MMSSGISIRQVRLEDAKQLHKLINEAYRTDKSWTTEAKLVKGERITMDALVTLIEQDIDPILVAELSSNDNVVGCICAESSSNHPTLGLPSASALLGLLAVSPSHQSKGIGRQLVDACMVMVRERWSSETALNWVIEQRVDIQKWYARLGFQWNGETKDFVQPANALIDNLKFKVYQRTLPMSR